MMRWPPLLKRKTEPPRAAGRGEGDRVLLELNSPDGARSHTFTLSRPIYSGPRKIEVIELRAPSPAALERFYTSLPHDLDHSEFDRAAAAISLLTCLDLAAIETISARDFLELCDGIAPILEDVMKE
jgi:hypothetical protein